MGLLSELMYSKLIKEIKQHTPLACSHAYFPEKLIFPQEQVVSFVGVLHWILIRSLEFLALLRMLKWHQLHFLYWNLIVPAWPHFFVLHMFSLLWAASLPWCAQRIRKSGVFVFLVALLVPPWARHPSDKASFLAQDKAALLAQGTRAPFPVQTFPRAWQLCAERSWHAGSSPSLWPSSSGEHAAMGSGMAVGQWGPGWPVTAHRTMWNQPILLREGKKEWKAEEGESEHLCVQN